MTTKASLRVCAVAWLHQANTGLSFAGLLLELQT